MKAEERSEHGGAANETEKRMRVCVCVCVEKMERSEENLEI